MAETSPHFSETALALLRANIGFFDSEIPGSLDTYLRQCLEKSFFDYGEMNIHLQPGILTDDFDQATYAAWLYRNGIAGAGKTEQLKSIIRNRQVNKALNTTEGSA